MLDVLVTGAAGFIGYHASLRLLEAGHRVVGIDTLTPYYEVELKQARLTELARHAQFHFESIDVADGPSLARVQREAGTSQMLHLAAQAGVRYSIQNPQAFVHSNLVGFANVLEVARESRTSHLVFASSSSVYGARAVAPFRPGDDTSHPLSLYAATKKANEVMAHSYAHLFGVPSTGLRLFTVYGPWGRPDMAAQSFVRRLFAGEPIDVYQGGAVSRDFTYVDDVVEAIVRLLSRPPQANPLWAGPDADAAGSTAPFQLYNVGNHTPVTVSRLLEILEQHTGRTAIRRDVPLPPSDVPMTCADVSDLQRAVDFVPATPLEEGLRRLVEWYREYYRV